MATKGCRMYPVDYYEHGLYTWSLSGGRRTDPWDTAYNAGWVAIPDDALGHEYGFTDPRMAARWVLEDYTAACNGDVWMVVGERFYADGRDTDLDIISGYYGQTAALEAMVEVFAAMDVHIDTAELYM